MIGDTQSPDGRNLFCAHARLFLFITDNGPFDLDDLQIPSGRTLLSIHTSTPGGLKPSLCRPCTRRRQPRPFHRSPASTARAHAAYLLGTQPVLAKAAINPLRKALTDPSDYVRLSAIMALQSLGSPLSPRLPDLEAIQPDSPDREPEAAKTAIDHIKAATPAQPKTQPSTLWNGSSRWLASRQPSSP